MTQQRKRYGVFSYGSILMDYVAGGEPNIFRKPVSPRVKQQRAKAIRDLWWEDKY